MSFVLQLHERHGWCWPTFLLLWNLIWFHSGGDCPEKLLVVVVGFKLLVVSCSLHSPSVPQPQSCSAFTWRTPVQFWCSLMFSRVFLLSRLLWRISTMSCTSARAVEHHASVLLKVHKTLHQCSPMCTKTLHQCTRVFNVHQNTAPKLFKVHQNTAPSFLCTRVLRLRPPPQPPLCRVDHLLVLLQSRIRPYSAVGKCASSSIWWECHMQWML